MACPRVRYAPGIVAALFLFAGTADAGHPHDRNGFFIGFGLGAGSANPDFVLDADKDSQGGGVLNFRIGGAVADRLLLGFESSAWFYGESVGNMDIRWVFSANTAGVTWYPIPHQGMFLRGGLGFGQVRVEVETLGVTVSDNENGLGVLGAVGYEWRLSRKFALGPQIEVVHLAIDGTAMESVTMVNGALQFDWYW